MFMDNTIKLAASIRCASLPPEVIEKIRNTIKNPVQKNESDFLIAKLKFLKLKGEKRDDL